MSLEVTNGPDGRESVSCPVDSVVAGGIHIFIGPMFAGKSTALLRSVRKETKSGNKVVLLKPQKDDRYSNDSVVTHNGDKEACFSVQALGDFREQLASTYKQCDVIAIDEGQFFPDLYEFCLSAADDDGKVVYVAGLDGDFQRKSFGRILDLIPHADSVEKLRSKCAFCSLPGLFSLRTISDNRQEIVGGADIYKPACRRHFNQLHIQSPLQDVTTKISNHIAVNKADKTQPSATCQHKRLV